MSFGKRTSSFIFFFANIFLPYVGSQICLNNGNYTTNSTYQTNLNTLLSSLPTNISSNGFYNANLGQNPDIANALVLCRGDIQLDECRRCVQDATFDLTTSCPNQRQAIIWNELCMLRYSNESMVGIRADNPRNHYWTTQNASSTNQFMTDRGTLLDIIRGRAAFGGSVWKVAAGNINAPNNQTIYGLVQCTPDLTSEDCSTCLMGAASDLPNTRTGGRVMLPSCNVRYDIYLFYNETRLQELGSRIGTPQSESIPTQPSPPTGTGDSNTTRTIIIVVVSVVLAFSIGFLLRRRINQKPKEEYHIGEEVEEISVVESLQYEFGIIRAATNDFSDANKLGQGGFGVVYKGILNDQEIAVKRLSRNSGQGDLEFKNEVMLLTKLQHRNLVRLMGFSIEGTEKLLVYEFVQNASLDHFIFDPVKRSFLNWDKRYNIIRGVARGLLYLHEDSRLKIIHRDLKASNVLLDGDDNPKIADFGMAKLFVPDETQGSTGQIVGTYGYMPPEYAFRGQFSVKLDVYSYGVLVMEIISGQQNKDFRIGENFESLVSYVWKNWHDGTTINLIDPVLKVNSSTPSDILRCIHIALLCVQENPVHRPRMGFIVQTLINSSIKMPTPSEPAFYVSGHELNVPFLQEFNSRNNDGVEPLHMDQNNVSLTELDPR